MMVLAIEKSREIIKAFIPAGEVKANKSQCENEKLPSKGGEDFIIILCLKSDTRLLSVLPLDGLGRLVA